MITYNKFFFEICNNKIQMFGVFRDMGIIRDQLSLENAESFLKDVQTIVFFVNNVPLKGSLRDYNEVGFQKTRVMFEKAARTYGVKIILPFRTLLLRVLDQNIGYIQLHTFFLELCNNFYVPKQALNILQRPAFFRNISKNKICEFLVQGCDIYIKLGEYKKAYEIIRRGVNLEFMDFENTLKLNSRLIVLQINMGVQKQSEGKQIHQKAKEKQSEARERLKFLLLKFDNSIIATLSQELKKQINFKVQFYISLKVYRQLTELEKNILFVDGLLQVYENSKWTSLKKYINQEIKGSNWRIKAETIKDKPLADMEVIRGINKNGQIYRYDCKNNIMYFNHKESDQEKLNSLISLAMSMSEEVSNCRIEKSEHDVGGRGMKIGGFGGGMQFFRRLG